MSDEVTWSPSHRTALYHLARVNSHHEVAVQANNHQAVVGQWLRLILVDEIHLRAARGPQRSLCVCVCVFFCAHAFSCCKRSMPASVKSFDGSTVGIHSGIYGKSPIGGVSSLRRGHLEKGRIVPAFSPSDWCVRGQSFQQG